ncbi:MAG: histidine kinase dimerization/phosphoacceptor domain -containing protein [Syntrophothermus sp.]
MAEPIVESIALKVLSLEDSIKDFEIICEVLADAGYNLNALRIDTKDSFEEAIQSDGYDIILVDFNLPGFNAFGALELCNKFCPNTPVICVSGSIGEETAIKLLKQGAVDYILKERLDRLPFAIKRAINEAIEKEALRQAEVRLIESEQKFRLLFETAKDGIFQITTQGEIVAVNEAFARMHGYTAEEMLHMNIKDLDTPETQRLAPERMKKLLSGEAMTIEIEHFHRNGTIIPIEVSANLATIGDQKCVLGFHRDITARKLSEEARNKSLREKEVLLKEIHHRVKNNLQIISSLLSLQSNYIEDDKSRKFFTESMNRVKSMAMVHEKLYLSENLNDINVNEYITELVSYLIRIYDVNYDLIIPSLEIDSISIPLDSAIPCGLIINEIIANIFEHAFPDGTTGHIYVRFTLQNDEYMLTIKDDGIGLSEGFDVGKLNSLGLLLVHTLVGQLHGKIELKGNCGTEYNIRFPAKCH